MRVVSNITVRKAKMNDLRDLLRMSYEFFLETMEGAEYEFSSEDVSEQIVTYLKNDNAAAFIAEHEGSAIGFVGVYVAPAYYNKKINVVSDHSMYVDPDYRNGSAVKCIVAAVKNWAKSKNAFWFRAKIVDGKRYKIQKLRKVSHGG